MVVFQRINTHGSLVDSKRLPPFPVGLKLAHRGSDVDGGSDARARDHSYPNHVPTCLTLSSQRPQWHYEKKRS